MSKILEKIKKNEKTANFPYLILLVSILITIGVTYNFYQSAKSKDSIRFNNEVSRIQLSVENRIGLYIALLKGGRGFIESTAKLNRQSFSNYVKSLELDKNYVGMLGIGYNKVLLPDEREALIKQMRAEGYSDFRIFPETERAVYQTIIYLEPLNERNEKAIGYDMSTEENRRDALNRAKDTGDPAASAKVLLLQENEQENESDKQAGFLIYLPIYKNGKIPLNLEERRQNLTGYIYSPFRAGDFLDQVREKTSSSDIAVKIYDGQLKPENLMAQTTSNATASFINTVEENYSAQKNLDVAGRNWIIKYDALPSFAAESSVGWTPLILLSGIIFSFLLFGMTYWEASARAKLQTTAAELFELEKQKQTLLEKEQTARLSAENANKTKDEFIAVVSHELRTPLNAIAGWARILKTDNVSANTKNLALEKIDKNLRLQTHLVEELLDYSQIISGNINVEGKKVIFPDVFECSCREIEEKAREKSIEFIKDNQLNGHTILGDEDKVKIVIHNLLSNAVKFTHSGGKVEASVKQEGDNIQIIIKDNGQGISPEFLPHIFDRFNQADNSSTRNYGGLGLGLAITNHIVKLHNGTIKAQSEGKGKGSVFVVKFPVHKH
ncbi:MAG: CHASE domain-containing protein [Acidobacteria bacterium]|nr:CHASE domain-containing protein [Acidobacteriota bacterium]